MKNPVRNVMYSSTQGTTTDKVRFFNLVMTADGVLILYDSGDQPLPTTLDGVQSGQIQSYPNSIPTLANIVMTGTNNINTNPKAYTQISFQNKLFTNTTTTDANNLDNSRIGKICIYPYDAANPLLTTDTYPYYTTTVATPNPIPKPSFGGMNYILMNTPPYNSAAISNTKSALAGPSYLYTIPGEIANVSAMTSSTISTASIPLAILNILCSYYDSFSTSIWYALSGYNCIYRLNLSDYTISQIGNTYNAFNSITDGFGMKASFSNQIGSITSDNNGTLYLFDNRTLRKVHIATQTVTTLPTYPLVNVTAYAVSWCCYSSLNNTVYYSDGKSLFTYNITNNTTAILSAVNTSDAAVSKDGAIKYDTNVTQGNVFNPGGQAAFDSVNNIIYFCETNTNKLRTLNIATNYIGTLVSGSFWNGTSTITFANPNSVYYDPTNKVIYVSTGTYSPSNLNTPGHHYVLQITNPLDSTKRTFSVITGMPGTLGSNDTSPGTYHSPIVTGIYDNQLMILDRGNNRLRKFDLKLFTITSIFNGYYSGSGPQTLVGKPAPYLGNTQHYFKNPYLQSMSNMTTVGNTPYQPLSPPYYFGFASLNYGYSKTNKHMGQIGLYLMGTKPNGEVAAYHEFPLTKGRDYDVVNDKFLSTSTGINLNFGNTNILTPNNYQFILSTNSTTMGIIGVLSVMELSTGYTMIIITR